MANPRKFSEKIALHTQKQAEETAKFEEIMKEVSVVTAKVLPTAPDRGSGKHTLRINQSLGSFRGGSLPNVSAGGPKSATHNKEIIKPEPQDTSHYILAAKKDAHMHSYHESRPRVSSSVGPMRRTARIDTSPYSGPYLSPPPDTSWRRTSSDSALHNSAMQGGGERNDNLGSRWGMQNTNCQEQTDRPKSSCDVPSRVPGINIYPSALEPGTVQIPIGNNTGSLPDLTSVHFPSPLHTPIDQEADHSSSPYSSSPVNTSPATLSPTSVPGMRTPQGQFHFSSPNSQHQNHLSVPVNSRYLHLNKGIKLENNVPTLVDGINYNTHPSLSLLSNMYQQQCPPPASSPTQHQPPISGSGYRSPLPRPSPQSSPGLGGRHSAPSSPAAPSPMPDYFSCHPQQSHFTATLQQFEQFSMMDQHEVNYMDPPTTVPLSQSPNRHQTLSDVTNMVGSSDLGDTYYSTSPSPLYSTPHNNTTPNTPTSIPNIILTDFSNPTDDLRQDFSDELNSQEFSSKDISNVITGALDGDFFPSDESLRAGLGQIDVDGLQMLNDPDISIISDNQEDLFRFDRL